MSNIKGFWQGASSMTHWTPRACMHPEATKFCSTKWVNEHVSWRWFDSSRWSARWSCTIVNHRRSTTKHVQKRGKLKIKKVWEDQWSSIICYVKMLECYPSWLSDLWGGSPVGGSKWGGSPVADRWQVRCHLSGLTSESQVATWWSAGGTIRRKSKLFNIVLTIVENAKN